MSILKKQTLKATILRSKDFIFLKLCHYKRYFKQYSLKIFQAQSARLSSRLLLFFTCLSLFVWTTTALVTWFTGKEHINTFFDTQQILFAKTLASTNFSSSVVQLPETQYMIGADKRAGDEDDDVLAFAIFAQSGELLLSDSDHGYDFPFHKFNLHNQGFLNLQIEEDEDDIWRIFYLQSLDGERIIAVGQEEEYRQDMVWDFLIAQLMPWIFSIPLLLAGLGFLVYRELAPLRKITQTLLKRKPDDSTPISTENIVLEIKPLVQELNALFVRTNELLIKERAFVANAAHELRTPLAGLAIQAEVIGMCDNDKKAQEHAITQLTKGITRCTRLIEQLLLLSSLETKGEFSQTKCTKPLSLLTLHSTITTLVSEAKHFADERNIQLSYTVRNAQATQHTQRTHLSTLHNTEHQPEHQIKSLVKQETKQMFTNNQSTSYTIEKDAYLETENFAELWAIALRNVLDNAIRHSNVNTSIYITLSPYALCVENCASPISQDILPRLGQRFYRPPGQNTRGTGLGLAIVQHICQLYRTSFIIDNCQATEQKSYLPDNIPISVDGVIACIVV